VLKTNSGYVLFYSRFNYDLGPWNAPDAWTIGCVQTKDFAHFDNDRDISPASCASPGDCVMWGGRYVLPYQRYPRKPVELCFSESDNLRRWSSPKPFLEAALQLPWNKEHRVIDPTFIVVGNTLHCFFVGSAMIKDAAGKPVHTNLLGHAITTDPSLDKWQILTPDQPLIGPSPRAPDGVENIAVFKTGNLWTMVYSEGLVHQHIARATSPDLMTWTETGPIELPVQKWMARRYGAPYVWADGDGWVMILMGENAAGRTTFGLLTSHDGVQWSLLPEN
jgi:sucrose-6-phosphate hydrolase SacC (GH32 family)